MNGVHLDDMNDQGISILGCGWLGMEVAKRLIAKGYQVKGSTTRAEKAELLLGAAIQPYVFSLLSDKIEGTLGDFLESPLLLLNIPPGRRDPDVGRTFPLKIATLLKQVPNKSNLKCIWVSSTSVYGNLSGEVREGHALSPATQSGKALVEVEEMVQAAIPHTTILRMGGLVGPKRHPGKFLAGRQNLRGANQAINLIHLVDCVGIIEAVIEQNCWGEDFNCVSDGHPTREAYYTYAAKILKLPLPEFADDDPSIGKTILNEKVKERLGYSFQYSDPFDMLANKMA
ncbi:MAG: SDR family oxidoreductase [Bacteroidota bacterium]